jgi:hypothetical protein
MNHGNHPPTHPRNGRNGHGAHISQRGLLSIAMLLASIGSLVIAMLAGMRVVYDMLGGANDSTGAGTKLVVIGLAYVVGWVTAMIATRIYGNLVLPFLLQWAMWAFLIAICALYVLIIQRMYAQPDELSRFIKYLLVMAGGLAALVGLHLVIEGHDLRPFAIPLLIICLFHLGLIVFRYVFTVDVKPEFLWKDLVFFGVMVAVAVLMLAHVGVLDPARVQLTALVDGFNPALRSND